MASKKETRKITIIADGKKVNASFNEIRNSAKILQNQLNKLPKGTQRWIDKNKELAKVKGSLKEIKTEMGQVNTAQKNLTTSITAMVGAFGAVTIGTKIIGFFTDSSEAAKEFEASISSLSSITGAVGEDLEFFEEQALAIGSATTLSASQTAEAFKLIGSAKPELLGSKEALVAVTKEAIALAEAAGLELPEAAAALTTSMNQFGLAAEESSRVINILAAGSKEGAGDINFLNESISKFGPTANAMNISLEQSAAAMEVLAEKGITAEKAGVGFRNILVELAKGADEFNPEVVGMSQALENLGKANLDTAELAEKFGKQNLAVAQILADSGDRFDEFTEKLTGTQVAYDQAATNTDNFKGDMKGLGSAIEGVQINIGSFINAALRPLIKGFTALLLGLSKLPEFLKENLDLFIAFGIALVTFNAATIASTAAAIAHIAVEKGRAIATRASAIAQGLMNAAMTANPIGLVIKAIGLLVAGFVVLFNRSETVRAGIAGLANVAKEVFKIISETVGQFIGGFKKIIDGDFKEGLKDIGSAIVNTNPIGLAITQGERLAGAFTTGYKDKLEDEKAATAEKQTEIVEGELTAQEKANAAKLAANQEALDAKAEQEKVAADKRAVVAAEKAKEEAKKVQAARDDFDKLSLKATQDLENLRVAAIADSSERQIAELELKHQREITKINEQRAMVTANIALTEQEKQATLDQFAQIEQAKLAEKEAAKTQILVDARETDFLTRLEQEAEQEEIDKALLEEKFLLSMESQFEKDLAFLDLERAHLEARQALLDETGNTDVLGQQQIKNRILAIDKEKKDKIIKNEEDIAKTRKENRDKNLADLQKTTKAVLDVITAATDLKLSKIDAEIAKLSEDSDSREKNALKIKQLEDEKVEIQKESAKKKQKIEVGQAVVSGLAELAGIWQNAGSMGIPGIIFGAIQSVAAIARTVINVKKIKAQTFADGGGTLDMLYKNGAYHQPNGGAAKNVGSFKTGGHIGSASMGLIGEAGSEWVAPNWMLRSPKHANLIGYLEGERVRGRAFQEGGETSINPANFEAIPIPEEAIEAQANQLAAIQEINTNIMMLNENITTWATTLKVVNDPTETEAALMVVNEIDNDSNITR